MNGEDLAVSIVLGTVVYVFITFMLCGICFGADEGDDFALEENTKNYIVLVLWPLTMVLLLPVIVVGLFKVAWWLIKAAGLYVIGIKDLYKKLVTQ